MRSKWTTGISSLESLFILQWMCVCISLHMVTCIYVSACYQICQYVFAVLFKQSDVAKFFRETMQRVKELVHFGGFLDCEYLWRTLAKEFQQMESRYFFLAPFHFHQIVVLILVSFYDLENLNKYEKRALIASLKKTIYIYIYMIMVSYVFLLYPSK